MGGGGAVVGVAPAVRVRAQCVASRACRVCAQSDVLVPLGTRPTGVTVVACGTGSKRAQASGGGSAMRLHGAWGVTDDQNVASKNYMVRCACVRVVTYACVTQALYRVGGRVCVRAGARHVTAGCVLRCLRRPLGSRGRQCACVCVCCD
jgi:hypothetical protein